MDEQVEVSPVIPPENQFALTLHASGVVTVNDDSKGQDK